MDTVKPCPVAVAAAADVEILIGCIILLPGADNYQRIYHLNRLLYLLQIEQPPTPIIVKTLRETIRMLNEGRVAVEACERMEALCDVYGRDLGQRKSG